jgi:carbon-monoxide dehydrogenase large subunit
MPRLIGTEVRRVEDTGFLRGIADYLDDLRIEGVLQLAFVRSPLPHAAITGIDTAAAAAAPGVVAVYTADDLGIRAHHGFETVNDACTRPPLARGKVRFVGEAVAVVVADTAARAVDAADLVGVDYQPLPAVVDPEAALAADAPAQFEQLGGNLAAGTRSDPATDPLADAEVVVRARIENQRVAVVPIECNAVAVLPGADGGELAFTAFVPTQLPHSWRAMVADLFGLDPARVRVVAPQVGGGFGGKVGVFAEHSTAVAAALRLGRPVKWVETRSENLTSMHGRAMTCYGELGLRRTGEMTGLRLRVIGDAGAYAGFAGTLAVGPTYSMAPGPYRIPKVGYDVAVALTNTTPVGGYRGSGRPEATAVLERLVDLAARRLDVDPAELRRRNFLRPGDFPVSTAVGTRYDSGDYPKALAEALRIARYPELRAEQARRRATGERTVLGIGVASYVEITAGGGSREWGSVTVHADGTATASAGTSAHGQGHATAFAMVVSDRLGIPVDAIRYVQSDTALVPRGGGTGGSRSLQLGGSAVQAAAGVVLDRARKLAADLLEAAPDDIEVTADGRLGVVGSPDSALSWQQLATEAADRDEQLHAEVDVDQGGPTFPFGSHLSVVEVDLDTGLVRPVRHVAVDDCGTVLNPMIVRGQQHGGVTQGIGQALWEHVRFDPDGNPVTTTLATYSIPAAADLPDYEVASTETPTPRNALGAKGIGEAGTIGALPAVQNAVVDALAHLGVRHVDSPCTPERVWSAIRAAAGGGAVDPWREPPAVFAALPIRDSSAQPATSVL